MDKRLDFEKVESKGMSTGQIITDTQTGVQYLLCTQAGVGAAMTILVDKDGKPVLKK